MDTPIKLLPLEQIEETMLNLPQVEIPVTHYFTDSGIYAREIIIPAGTLAIGHSHNQDFMEVFMEGTIVVPSDSGPIEIKAPYVNKGLPHVRKLGLTLTDCKWVTFHQVPEGYNTVEAMEELIIEKSETFKLYEKELLCQLSQQQ